MNLTSTTICPECSAILDAPDDAENVTCTDCGRLLLLQRGPTRTGAVAIAGWEGLGAAWAAGRWPLPADQRAQARKELEAAWQAERKRLAQPGLYVLGRLVTRRAPSVWHAALWIVTAFVVVALQVVSVGRGTMTPMWWISGAATVVVCLHQAYVEYVAAADLARARRQYEAMRTAIVVGEPQDLRDRAQPGSSMHARWSGPAVGLVIVLLLTAAATVALFAWSGAFK